MCQRAFTVALRLTQEQLSRMLAQAVAQAPNECCGLLLGTGDVVADIFPGRNIRMSPRVYELDPQDQLRAFRLMDERGWDLVGIYHSHPATEAYPSRTDQAQALYPDARYVIISLADQDHPRVRAFRIVDAISGGGGSSPIPGSSPQKVVTEEEVVVT
jgi:proteasome lid subunit RPN8/RPN11